MTISIIAALAENNVIGKDNDLIWHLPKDLKHFKNLTTGHHVIMGRKTFESIGRVLPNRTFIIVTRNKSYQVSGAIVTHSLQEAIERVENDNEAFIIGGAEIYRQSLSVANKMYLTKVHANFEGDAFFPEFEPTEWKLVSENQHKADEKNKHDFTFQEWEKLESI